MNTFSSSHPQIPLCYMPADEDEGNWGYELNRLWCPRFCGTEDSPRFWADTQSAGLRPHGDHDAVTVSRDFGLVHSVLLPGEVDWEALEGTLISPQEAVEQEIRSLRRFKALFVLSNYFKECLAEKGIKTVGILKYPLVERENIPPLPKKPRVLISQRFSEEKFPLLVMRVAEQMPDVDFVFTGPRIPAKKYLGWLCSSKYRNVSFVQCPSKADVRRQLGLSSCSLIISGQDNFGVAAAEALANRRAVVAPNKFAFPEFIDKRWLYHPYDLEDIDRCIRIALASHCPKAPWSLQESFESLNLVSSRIQQLK